MPTATATAAGPDGGASALALRGPVLLATDGQGPTDAPARAARRIAERLAAPLEVLAVLQPLPAAMLDSELTALPPGYEARRRTELEAAVRQRLEPVLGPAERWPLDTRWGSVGRTIAETARERRAGLIVVGTGGHRALDRLLGEEVSLQVVRHASAPVLAVAPELDGPFSRAVVGVDFGAASTRAARVALALLEPDADGTAQLTLVCTRPPIEDMPAGIAGWATDYEANVGAMFARLREALRPFVRAGVTVETRVRAGAVAESLRDAAEETGATLVAVGTHGGGWAERLFVGSVATTTLRRAGRSVLIVPAPGAAERVRLELAVTRHIALERPEDWAGALDALTHRNAGRRARLEVGGHGTAGPVLQADHCRFLGAAYDPHDRRVEIMLEVDTGGFASDVAERTSHLTHGIPHVRAVEIAAEGARRDHVLLVEDDRGETVLTFLD